MDKFESFEMLKTNAWKQSLIIFNSKERIKSLKRIKNFYMEQNINLDCINLYLEVIKLYLSFLDNQTSKKEGELILKTLQNKFNKQNTKNITDDDTDDDWDDFIRESVLFSTKIIAEFKKQKCTKGTISFTCPVCKTGTVMATKFDKGFEAHCLNCDMSILT